MSLLLLLALAGVLWSPPGNALSDADPDAVASLEALFTAPVRPDVLVEGLESLTEHRPDRAATEALAQALAACEGIAALDEPRRAALARHLWAIMHGGDLTAGQLARVLDGIQQVAQDSNCAPVGATGLMQAAHAAARRVADERRDWW